MKHFVIEPSDHGIWNRNSLEKFLVDNQHQRIYLDMKEGPDCDKIGLFDLLDMYSFESVEISTLNAVQKPHPKYKIVWGRGRHKFFKTIQANITQYSNLHCWNQHKIFSVFYNRPIWHRIGIASHMTHYHRDLTLLNFRYDPQNPDTRNQFEVSQLFDNHVDSIKTFASCVDQWPATVEKQDGYTLGATTEQHTDQLCEFYPHALIDIVAETFVNGQTFFTTEKTVRPMLLKKPFIAMAAQNHLLYLRQMGFQTFYEFWDEDYDGYSMATRYQKILALIDTLASKPMSELNKMYADMQPILDHNYNLLVRQSYNKQPLTAVYD